MSQKRLTENHPTWLKVQKWFDMADELGIYVELNDHNPPTIKDQEFPDKEFLLMDLDNESVYGLPPPFEHKIVRRT